MFSTIPVKNLGVNLWVNLPARAKAKRYSVRAAAFRMGFSSLEPERYNVHKRKLSTGAQRQRTARRRIPR